MANPDEQWHQKHLDELEKIRQGLADEERRDQHQAATLRAEREREAASPVQPGRRRPGAASVAARFVVLILLVVFSWQLGWTIAQFTGPDIADAKRTGQATVRSCERHGPVGNILGYWHECTAEVVWADGSVDQVTPDKPNFFSADEIGSTVTIGDMGSRTGGQSYARAELPSRPLVVVVAGIFVLVAVLLGALLLWIAWAALRQALRPGRRREGG